MKDKIEFGYYELFKMYEVKGFLSSLDLKAADEYSKFIDYIIKKIVDKIGENNDNKN